MRCTARFSRRSALFQRLMDIADSDPVGLNRRLSECPSIASLDFLFFRSTSSVALLHAWRRVPMGHVAESVPPDIAGIDSMLGGHPALTPARRIDPPLMRFLFPSAHFSFAALFAGGQPANDPASAFGT